MRRTLLVLGGARYIVPVIEAAHQLGVDVVTCDYLPENEGHRYSDRYVNASIIDRDAILEVAVSTKADGIMSFAADPGVVSAAYAAEILGLPFQGSLESVEVLQDKGKFRHFLTSNGFNCPESWTFTSSSDALEMSDQFVYPVMVKPVDSAGSKGCRKVESKDRLAQAVKYALSYSPNGTCIVESFLEKVGDSSDADGFLVNGSFDCISFTSQLFNSASPNPYTPASYTMPATMPEWAQRELTSELQRLATLLELKDGVFNIETRLASDGRPYIMELAPRGGGNRLAEMLRFATGGKTDLVRGAVQAALGVPVDSVSMPEYSGFWYQQMIHSPVEGTFIGIEYAKGFKGCHVVEEQLWVKTGDKVSSFLSANHAFGSVMLRFETSSELEEFRQHPENFMKVIVL